MTSIHLLIELLTDAVFTEHSATLGHPRSLDHVPGAALLGVAARQYERFGADAWAVFHAGKVRFGDGVPPDSRGNPTLPMPLSLERPRGSRLRPGEPLPPGTLNLARGPRGRKMEPLRRGFLSRDGVYIQPKHRGSMRTAIGEGGRAREGLLYSMDAIEAGTRYYARVDLDPDMAHLSEALRDTLCGEVGLGRSLSAEFGRARITEIQDPPMTSAWPDAPGAVAAVPRPTEVLLLLESDLALRDPSTGAPTLEPVASMFGLPDTWDLDHAHSFSRYRSWSPYNATRRRPDLLRQVLSRGSVLVFKGPALEGSQVAQVERRLARGVGEHRQDGLGRVLVEPSVLTKHDVTTALSVDTEVIDTNAPRVPSAPHASPPLPRDPLGAWLSAAIRRRDAREDAFALARELAARLEPLATRVPASQWRALGREALVVSSREELGERLFGEAGFTRVGVTTRRWEAPWRRRPLWEHLRDTLLNAKGDHGATLDDLTLIQALPQLTERLARASRAQEDR